MLAILTYVHEFTFDAVRMVHYCRKVVFRETENTPRSFDKTQYIEVVLLQPRTFRMAIAHMRIALAQDMDKSYVGSPFRDNIHTEIRCYKKLNCGKNNLIGFFFRSLTLKKLNY